MEIYISKGLLLPPEGSGVNSLYNDEHLERIGVKIDFGHESVEML